MRNFSIENVFLSCVLCVHPFNLNIPHLDTVCIDNCVTALYRQVYIDGLCNCVIQTQCN